MNKPVDYAIRSGISRRTLLKGSAGLAAASASLPLWGAQSESKTIETNRKKAKASTYSANGANTRLILLGTSGGPNWYPHDERHGFASALVVGDSVYLVGCGEGVGNQYQKGTRGINSIPSGRLGLENLRGIFFSHLHSDHVAGYPTLLLYGLYSGLPDVKRPVEVYGPGPRDQMEPVFHLPGKSAKEEPTLINPENPTPGTRDMTRYLFQAFALDINDRMRDNFKPDLNSLIHVNDIELPDISGFKSPNETPDPDMGPFTVYEDEKIKVSATLVYHYPIWPAFAYRFDTDEGSVVFSGDTAPSDNLIHMAKGADILVHEVIDSTWVASHWPPPRNDRQQSLYRHLLDAHTTEEDVGKVAERAEVKTLVLSHIVPGNAQLKNLLRAQNYFSGQLLIGEDLMEIGVGRKPQTTAAS